MTQTTNVNGNRSTDNHNSPHRVDPGGGGGFFVSKNDGVRYTNALARIARALAEKPEGFTLSEEGYATPKRGYAVALRPFVTVTDAADALARGEVSYVGGWTDTVTGKHWLDAVVIIRDLQLALQTARKADQLAIWDFGAGAEIRLGVA